jgi:hypothetical protein
MLSYTNISEHKNMLIPKVDHQGAVDILKSAYRKFGGTKTFPGLNPTCIAHPNFEGCVQWHFTPEEVIDFDLFNVTDLNTKAWGVLVNVEKIHYLMMRGVDPKNIFYWADCEWRATWAKKVLGESNIFMLPNCSEKIKFRRYIKMAEKKVDFVLNNVPFGMFKEFKELAQKLAREKVLIISGSRDYHNGGAFENVEVYKYLGACFPTAKITASVAFVNPNGVTQLTIVSGDGKTYTVAPNPEVTPGDNIDVWIFATDVVNKKLPGYVNAEKGTIDRKSSRVVVDGIPVIFSAGKNGEDFTIENQATTPQSLIKDNTKFCWAIIDPLQQDLIGGLGKHKVVVTHAANEPGHLGNPKYAGPTWGCGVNCWFIECADEDDAKECIKYLTHPDVIKLVKGLKSSVVSNSKAVWKQIPHHAQASNWINNYA